jgi:hypothetical protein
MFKLLVWLAVFALFVYIGLQFGRPFYKEHMFQADVDEMVRFELNSPDALKQRIMESAKQWKVPLDENNLDVEGSSGDFRASAKWTEEVNILGEYRKTFAFAFDAHK